MQLFIMFIANIINNIMESCQLYVYRTALLLCHMHELSSSACA